jgi:serine/threonine-protein kinase
MVHSVINSIASFDASRIIGGTVGSATILQELARGNMGIVFTAFQQTLKRRIAVKILPKCQYTEDSVRLFEQEAEAAAGLSHPGIVPIYEIGETPDFRYFTMQLIDGSPLSEDLEKMAKNPIPSRRLLPVKTALSIVRQILEALAYAHRSGVVHRDIKPENILIVKGSQIPVITDFGIANMLSARTDSRAVARGSPLYMAPEQILGEDADARVDVYAAGVLLFRLLVERLPLIDHASHEDILRSKVLGENIFRRSPSQANPRLNPEMDSIVAAATAATTDRRYPACREFAEALAAYERKFFGSYGS